MYDKVCPTCNTLLSQFYNTGMLGCPDCYKAFEKEIIIALKKVQGRTGHVGKTPYGAELDKRLLADYQALIKAKERAGLEGRFADMKELSEEILALAEELKERGLI